MSISVRPAGYEFKLAIEAGEEKVEFTLKQLTYREKSYITGLASTTVKGEMSIDSTLTCFYNIKYALKDATGIVDENGDPYKLKFDDDKTVSDECIDELLASDISDQLQYSALHLSENRFPDTVIHPLSRVPIEGVSVIPLEKLAVVRKK